MKRALLSVVLVALAAAPAAAAQSGTAVGPLPGEPVAGPVFGDDGEVAWVERGGGSLRLVVSGLGGAPSVLATAGVPRGADTVTASLGLSRSSALLYALYEVNAPKVGPQPIGAVAIAGRRDALRPLSGEPASPYAFPLLAGDRVAFRRFAGPDTAIRFLDPVTGEQSDVLAGGGGTPHAVAGDLVAHPLPGEERKVAVTNWRTGAELYRSDVPAGTFLSNVELAPDGSAVWTTQPSQPQPHSITTPQDSALRPLPLPQGSIVAGFAGDRVLYRLGEQWEVSDLDGRVAVRVPASVATAVPAVAGRRLAYLGRPCAMTVATVLDLDAPPPPAVPVPCRAARLDGRPTLRAGVLRVTLACDGVESAGCLTALRVTARRRGARRAKRFGGEPAMAAGERRTLSFPAGRGPRRVTIVTDTVRDGGESTTRRFRLRG